MALLLLTVNSDASGGRHKPLSAALRALNFMHLAWLLLMTKSNGLPHFYGLAWGFCSCDWRHSLMPTCTVMGQLSLQVGL